MKRLTIVIVLFSCILFSCNRTTQNAPNTENTVAVEDAPEMKFEQMDHDFGELNEGDIVKFPFKFKNIGKTPLVIKDVRVGCGCTVASKPEEPIAAGASSQIIVQFNSAGKAGIQKKFVTITSNALPEQTILSFSAIVNAKRSEEAKKL